MIRSAPLIANLKSEEKCVQVRVRRKCIVQGHSGGALIWCTPRQAQEWVDQNAVDIVGGELPPKEVAAADSGKLSSEQNSGLTTGSPKSTPSGEGSSSSVSAEDQASLESKPNESSAPAQEVSVESSQSTTPINDAHPQTSSTSQTSDGGTGTTEERTLEASPGKSARSGGRGRK